MGAWEGPERQAEGPAWAQRGGGAHEPRAGGAWGCPGGRGHEPRAGGVWGCPGGGAHEPRQVGRGDSGLSLEVTLHGESPFPPNTSNRGLCLSQSWGGAREWEGGGEDSGQSGALTEVPDRQAEATELWEAG